MSCGKHPLKKTWDKPRNLRIIKPSRYEQNEAHVKVHWRNVCKELELSYKDEQFWETNADSVRELVGPIIFERITKIFNLPVEEAKYEPKEELTSIASSIKFYVTKHGLAVHPTFSDYEYGHSEEEGEEEAAKEEESETWTASTINGSTDEKKREKGAEISIRSLHINTTKSLTKMLSRSFSRFLSKLNAGRSESTSTASKISTPTPDSEAHSGDDLNVNVGSDDGIHTHEHHRTFKQNPYYEMLYCNESETDMIKWKSKYKQKTYEVSASDEFTKKAEIMTKKISNEFYDWWVSLGHVEFKSEIKKPEDIEALFQVWFDEHASRSIVLDPKLIPCVLKSIAQFSGVIRASCLNALRRQITYDINAETKPEHKTAFGSSLPHHLAHIPPKNNTAKQWRGVKIPEDLRTMACVWEDIQHLTSTKSFHAWLLKHPSLPMPPFLKQMHAPGGDAKKVPYVVPSDYIHRDKGSGSAAELALPVSQFSIELKEVLSKLMNQ